MGDSTQRNPKCLIPLAGKPLLEWQLGALRRAGIDFITVARGYKAEMLEGNFSTVDNPLWEQTNMVSTLACAFEKVASSSCVISYSDIAYSAGHVRAVADSDGDIVVAYDTLWRDLWALRFENPLEDAETFVHENGRLVEIGARTSDIEAIQGQFMGLLRFTPNGFSVVKEYLSGLPQEAVAKLDMTALLSRLLAEGIRISVVPVAGQWCEADSMSDVVAYEAELERYDSQGLKWSHDWRE